MRMSHAFEARRQRHVSLLLVTGRKRRAKAANALNLAAKRLVFSIVSKKLITWRESKEREN